VEWLMQGRHFFLIDFIANFLFSEHVSAAIKREFIEEAMNSDKDGAKHIEKLFKTANSVKIFS
jgi:hypothetical protein